MMRHMTRFVLKNVKHLNEFMEHDEFEIECKLILG